MTKLGMLLVVGLFGCLSAKATLVIFMPTRDGIVAGADSEMKQGTNVLPFSSKIRFFTNRHDLVFTTTGRSGAKHPVTGKTWSAEGALRRSFNDASFMKLNETSFLALCGHVGATLTNFLNEAPEYKPFFTLTSACDVAIGQFDPSSRGSVFMSATVFIQPTGLFAVTNVVNYSAVSNGPPLWLALGGGSAYLKKHFIDDHIGRNFLPENFAGKFNGPQMVSQRSAEDARFIVKAFIQGVGELSKTKPLPDNGHVGGNPIIYLVTGTNAPAKLD